MNRRLTLSALLAGVPVAWAASRLVLDTALARQSSLAGQAQPRDIAPYNPASGADTSMTPALLAGRFEYEASAAQVASLPVLDAEFFATSLTGRRDWPERLKALIERDFSLGLTCVVGSWLVAEHEVAFAFAVRKGVVRAEGVNNAA